MLFEFILIRFFKTYLFVKPVFTYSKWLYFWHSSILEFGGGHGIKQLPRESPHPWPLVVTTTDLMFRKIFEPLWLDKLHVEMDLVWFWGNLWWFFVGYLNKCWILLQNYNCSCVTTFSILAIVNFSVTATCALYHFGLETAFPWTWFVEIQVTQLLTWNFAGSVTDIRFS